MLYLLSFIGGAALGVLAILLFKNTKVMGTVHILMVEPNAPCSMYLELNGPVESLNGLSQATFNVKQNSRL